MFTVRWTDHGKDARRMVARCSTLTPSSSASVAANGMSGPKRDRRASASTVTGIFRLIQRTIIPEETIAELMARELELLLPPVNKGSSLRLRWQNPFGVSRQCVSGPSREPMQPACRRLSRVLDVLNPFLFRLAGTDAPEAGCNGFFHFLNVSITFYRLLN
jgi:hypothetical protein